MAPDEENQIPSLPVAGDETGKQDAAPSGSALELVTSDKSGSGLEQYPMTEAVRLAADSGAFRSGGTKVFLEALSQLREADLKSARDERQSAQASADAHRDNYHAEFTKRAVLEERLRCSLPIRKFQNIFITIGGVLLGAGLQPLVTSFSPVYLLFVLVGIAMLLIGWFYPNDSKKGQQ